MTNEWMVADGMGMEYFSRSEVWCFYSSNCSLHYYFDGSLKTSIHLSMHWYKRARIFFSLLNLSQAKRPDLQL